MADAQNVASAALPARREIPLSHYIALGGGVAMEWYDWQIYPLMAALFGPHFFPSDNPVTSTLSALAVFAVGFFVRPISGAVFGPVADRIGHKKVLVVSIGVMALSSFVVGCIPTADSIGIWAGVIVVVVRLVQGFSTGIEQPAANAAGLELAPAGRRGFFGGVVSGSLAQTGNLMAALICFAVSAILGRETMAGWGWRVPFIIGGFAGVIVLYMRRRMPETGAAVPGNKVAESTGKVWQALGEHWLGLLTIIFLIGATQIANYTFLAGLPNLAVSVYKESPTQVFAVSTVLGFLLVGAGPISGWLADRFGPSRIYLILRTLLIPSFALMLLYSAPGISTLLGITIVGGSILALNQVYFQYMSAILMPPECRTTGVAVGFGIAVSVFGGTASYLIIWLQQRDQLWMFALYGAVMCTLSVLIYWWAMVRGEVHTDSA